VRHFAKLLAGRIASETPTLATTQQRIGKRQGKIYLDYMRNAVGQTAAAPYSLRHWPGATVSTPLDWSAVKKGLRPERFTIKTIFKRLRAKGDLLKPILKHGILLLPCAVSLEVKPQPVISKTCIDADLAAEAPHQRAGVSRLAADDLRSAMREHRLSNARPPCTRQVAQRSAHGR
jgi:DNA primase